MNNFDLLEKKLNIATTLIEELDFDDYEIVATDLTPNQLQIGVKEESTTEVFSIDTLKSDFTLIRQNILKLINTGQRVLDSASVIDPSDMKAATLTALSQLQQTLGANLQLLVQVYKEIAAIEKTRASIQGKTNEAGQSTNNGTVINNNTQVLFSGDTNALLGFLKENQANS